MEKLENYKTLFNHSRDGIIISENDGRIILANARIEHLLGYTQEEIRGSNMELFIPLRFRQDFNNQKKRYQNNPVLKEIGKKKGFIAQHKNGKELTIEVRLNPILMDGREVTVVSINDISESKSAADELLKSNERYAELLKNLDTGIVVHAPDTSIIKCNPKAEELLGLSKEQMFGKTALDPNWKFLQINGTELPLHEYPVLKVINSKQAFKSFQGGVYRPASNSVVWLIINGFPMLNQQGNITEIVISFHDITEQRHLHDEIEREMSSKDAFLNGSIDLFWSIDKELRLLAANEVFFNSAKRSNGGSLKLKEFVLREDLFDTKTLHYWKSNYEQVLSGKTLMIEYSVEKSQESAAVWFELKMSPISQNNKIIGVACFGKNITERKINELALTKAKERAEENEKNLLLKNNEFELVNKKLEKIASDLQKEISLREVIERTIPSGLSVVDASGKQVYVNQSFCELLGFSEAELIGKVAPFPYWPEIEIETITKAFQQTLIHGAPKEGFDLIFKHKSEKPIPVQVIVSSFMQGGASFWLANVIDITERKAKEIENKNKSQRINAIINNTNDIICSIDMNYNLVEFNNVLAGTILKTYGIEMKMGMPLLNFTDPTKKSHLISIYQRVQKGEIVNDIDSFFSISTHQRVFRETNFHPIYSVGKEVIGITIFSKDITERVKSEQKIISALKEKEILLAEIHHRIKNNLTLIWSLLQLQEMNTKNTEVKEALSLSRKRIKSTASIHELLYKSESLHNIVLEDYLKELFDYLRINNKIQFEYSGDGISLEMDTAMPLGLLLNELMLNSFKHSYTENSKGILKICSKLEYPNLYIDYIDFDGEFSADIDFKNPNTTGLTLAHTFAEQLNGSLELVNKTPPIYRIEIKLNEKGF